MWQGSYKLLIFVIYLILFLVISKILFLNIYDKTGYVIDELFHIPQGLNYCHLKFNTWDPKITTLPGLYLISTVILAPAEFCTVYGLRLTNLIAAFINSILFVYLFHLELDGSKQVSWSAIISGINMSILPPLYFFSHLYYTDTVSVTSVLLMIYLAKKERHISSSLIGIGSVIIRQTNIIWVAMIFGENVLNTFVNSTCDNSNRLKKYHNQTDFWNLHQSCTNFFRNGCNFHNITLKNYISIFSYFCVMLLFVLFVIINGGIVVGDKTAHTATIHVPQLFYFSLFSIIFALPHFFLEIIPFIKYVCKNKCLFLGLIATFICIAYYNTQVHPYLLADNRHYTFYIWNRIYQKYVSAKYLLTGVYIFGIYGAFKRIDAIKNFGFILLYVPCVSLVLVLQKLLDVRYFIIPFILLRLKFKTKNRIILILEYLMYLIINYVTFYIFFTKEIYWKDFKEAQRIMW